MFQARLRQSRRGNQDTATGAQTPTDEYCTYSRLRYHIQVPVIQSISATRSVLHDHSQNAAHDWPRTPKQILTEVRTIFDEADTTFPQLNVLATHSPDTKRPVQQSNFPMWIMIVDCAMCVCVKLCSMPSVAPPPFHPECKQASLHEREPLKPPQSPSSSLHRRVTAPKPN
jgi:hypothetical protein